jgi:hypothetical protein
MSGQNIGVGRVEDARLHRSVQQCLGMMYEVGVQGIVPGDHDHQTALTTSSGAPGLLSEAGDGTGKSTGHHGIETTDINSQFKSAGGSQSQQFPVVQTVLQSAPGLRSVAGAVGRDPGGVIGASCR